jgi:hypothetical protein
VATLISSPRSSFLLLTYHHGGIDAGGRLSRCRYDRTSSLLEVRGRWIRATGQVTANAGRSIGRNVRHFRGCAATLRYVSLLSYPKDPAVPHVTHSLSLSSDLDPEELPPMDEHGVPKYKGRKRGRKPKVRKRKANPNRRKRQHTAYTLFVQEIYPGIRQKHPGKPSKDLISMVAKQWADVAADKKKDWKARAQATHGDDDENEKEDGNFDEAVEEPFDEEEEEEEEEVTPDEEEEEEDAAPPARRRTRRSAAH